MNIQQQVVNFLLANKIAIGASLSLLGLSFVAHWPEKIPTSVQELWTWARLTFQTALPIQRVGAANPTQPK